MKLVPVSYRINSVHSLASYFLRSNLMLSPFYNSIFRVVFFFYILPLKFPMPYSSVSCMSYVMPFASSFYYFDISYLTNYEASHYAFYSTLPYISSFIRPNILVRMFFRTISISVLPLV